MTLKTSVAVFMITYRTSFDFTCPLQNTIEYSSHFITRYTDKQKLAQYSSWPHLDLKRITSQFSHEYKQVYPREMDMQRLASQRVSSNSSNRNVRPFNQHSITISEFI